MDREELLIYVRGRKESFWHGIKIGWTAAMLVAICIYLVLK